MKKIITATIFAGMLFGMTAYADILPPGQKQVPVCAYFNNTASNLDTMAVLGYETAPDGSKVDFSQFIANECFKPSYKFNTYKIYGVTANHAGSTTSANYDPSKDPEAYPSNIQPEIGYIYVPEDSTLERVENEYFIVTLETDPGLLVIAPERTKKYYKGIDEPVITEGAVTSISGSDTGTVDPGTGGNNTGDTVFSDVASNSPYVEALKYLKEQGIVKGYADGSFKPANTINRAELTKIIVEAAFDDKTITDCAAFYTKQGDYNVTLFTDVIFTMVGGNAPPWYFDYVCVGKHEGFLKGYSDGSFRPTSDINFAEAAKIITTGFGIKSDYSPGQNDNITLPPWYFEFVDALAVKNAIPKTIIAFNQKITRGEMAEIIYRIKADVTNLASQKYADLK